MTRTTYRGAPQKPPRQPNEPKAPITLKRRIRNIRRAIYGIGYRTAYWVLPWLPTWSVRVVGWLAIYPISTLAFARLADQNLTKVYGDQLPELERKRIRREMFHGLTYFLIEVLGVVRRGSQFFAGRIEDASARELISKLEAESPRGWIGVSPHMGNWVVLATWASSLPGDRGLCHAIAKRQPNPRLAKVLDEAQSRMEFRPIYTDLGPMEVVATCLKLLKRGGRLGIAPDQDSSKTPGVFLDFLGSPAYTGLGPAQLALASNVPLVPLAFVRRDKGRRFEIVHGEPIYPDQSRQRSRKDETIRLTEAWSRGVEELIHADKEQWVWFHRRWRTTPEKIAHRANAD